MINFYCTVEREPDRYTKAYIAKITGRHPKYALRRDFQLVRILTTPTVVKLRSELDNGVYECCIQQVNSKTHDVVKTERWWAIVADDDLYEYEYDELDHEDVMYALFNLKKNFGK